MLRLRLFGGAVLEGIEGPLGGAATQRRRIALLAVLASHPGGISRDRLIAWFWPDSPDERARHGLAQLLYAIRKDLGEDAITGSATMLRLDPSRLATDIHEFGLALTAGDLERANRLYAGPFLDGFYLSGCPEFERWVEEERGRLAERVCSAAECLARNAASGEDGRRAVEWWTRLAVLRPLDSRVALALAQAHVAAGDTPAAMRVARTHQLLVGDELGVAPDPSLAAFMATLQSAPPAAPVPANAPAPSVTQAATQAAGPVVAGAATADVDVERVASSGAHVAAGHSRRPRTRWLVPAGIAVTVVIAGGWALFGARGPLAGRDSSNPGWLLIADVENDTGDESFDRTLPLLVASGLRQSSRIWVVPLERVRESLARARAQPGDRLDADRARDVAVREGVGLVAVPAVSRAGSGFDVSLRILDARTGEVIDAAARHVEDRAGVIDAIDGIVRRSRRRLGEPAFSVASAYVPLPRVTTASIEALDLYARAGQAFSAARVDDARTLYEGAISLDSTFATAHASLGGLLYYVNEPAEAEVHFTHALSHVDGLDWRESAFLRSSIDEWRGDRQAAIATMRSVLAREPDNLAALHRLAYNQLRGDDPAEAAATLRRLVSLDSLDHNARINLATAEKALGHYDAALNQYARAFALRPGLATANNNINLEYASAWVLAGWPDSAAAVIAPMLDGDGNTRARGLRSMAFVMMYEGDYATAIAQLGEAIALNRHGSATVSEARNRLLLASALRLTGREADSRAQIDTAFLVGRDASDPTLLFWIGRALARDGDLGRASALLETIDRSRHPGSIPGQAASEGLRGEILVGEGAAAEGIAHLENAVRLDSTTLTLEGLARAAVAADQLDRGALLFAELGRNPAIGWEGQEHWRLASYQLGCLEGSRGRVDAAMDAFRAFLEVWPGASADIVPVRDARAWISRSTSESGVIAEHASSHSFCPSSWLNLDVHR
jgi:DNA-binding SARP family transcriptional activator/tetratricopeptide (TPR) repeat protein